MDGENALLVVDVQNDFCSGGALPVERGERVVPFANELMKRFEIVVGTQDWHPPEHKSFASSHPGKKQYETIKLHGTEQVLWPDHCVQGSYGAEFHRDLNTDRFSAIFRKGIDHEVDSYSAFRDNAKEYVTGLDGYLKSLGVRRIHISGLAADYCVYYTGMDGIENGYEVVVIIDATAGIDIPPGSMQDKLSEFEATGGRITKSAEYRM